ncbi:MAG: M48 family metallopeptidase [Firmicutes bacterium]|nr:M48 family metallopeptidase [Bacillota bacterium]MCL1954070.1 M48 family metallopeptidase [Bacillota bacterium]
MEYTLKKSKGKHIALVIKDGKLTVRVPHGTTQSSIDQFIQQKIDWINHNLEKTKLSNFSQHVLEYNQTFLNGNLVNIVAMDTGLEYKFGILYINKNYTTKSQIIRWAKDIANNTLRMELDRLSQFTGLNYTKFSLTSARTKWGSCDTKNRIMLNFRLIMLPQILQTYVILHELCHTKHHNHSTDFWKQVQSFCPNYKQLKQEIKKWSQINKLY